MVAHEVTISVEPDVNWIKALEHYTKPSRGDITAMEVTRLRSLTAKRKEGEFDLELSIGAITEELRIYPEDIVRTVCRNWSRNNKFFPVLKELIDECEKLFEPRYTILDAMRKSKLIEVRREDEKEKEKVDVSDLVAQCIKNLGAG